jgi:hypothetical protein
MEGNKNNGYGAVHPIWSELRIKPVMRCFRWGTSQYGSFAGTATPLLQ